MKLKFVFFFLLTTSLLIAQKTKSVQLLKNIDKEFYQKLSDSGFLFDFGEDESGLSVKYLRRGSGYYIDVGGSELIINGEIKLESPAEIKLFKEKSIFIDQAKASGKPDNVVEKIVEGKLNKFVQDNCLMHQSFVKNPDMTISQLVQEAVAKLGENITVNRFVRFALGEQSN